MHGRLARIRGAAGLAGATLLLLGVIWGTILAHLSQEKAAILAHRREESGNLARGFQESVARAFNETDQTMLFLRALWTHDPAGFNLSDWVASGILPTRNAVQVSITDRAGRILQSSLPLPQAPVADIADRAYFRAQVDAADDRLIVGAPVFGRVSHRLTLGLSRRLTDADGAFAGVVVISFAPESLNVFYRSLQIGHGRLTVAGADGIVRSRVPGGPQSDQPMRLEAPLGQLGRDRLARETILDGRSGRIVATRPVDGLSLQVFVELPLDEALAPYYADRWQYFIAGCIASFFISAIMLLLALQRRRMRLSRRKLALALESITQGLLMVTPGRRVAVINHRAIDLLGLPPAISTEGASFDTLVDWQEAHGEFRELGEDGLPRAIYRQARHFDPVSGVYERTRINGMVLEVRTTVLPDGSAVRTYSDITERRHAEEALRAARDAAEAGSRARAEFLAVMSHEIRTPLNGILGVAALLADRALQGEDAEHVRIIQQSGEHLLALVNDILDVSKLDANRMELEQAPFNLHDVLQGVVRLLAPQAERKGLALSLHMADGLPPWVTGDAARLGQILFNLLGNALKFTTVGSVELRVSPGGEGGPRRIRFEVEDTGIGIARQARGKLFKVFTQVDQTISRRFGGTGLGLAICQRLATLMGGEIDVISEPDKGSVFWFAVPLPPAIPLVAEARAPRPAAVVARPLRVLLAEDNAINRLVATRLLARRGHAVEAAEDGRQAFAALQRGRFDVLLTDVMMPEMDGIALTRAVRALPPPLGCLPIIGLTARTDADDVEECLRAGMNGHLAKPIQPERLDAVLGELGTRCAPSPAGAPEPAPPADRFDPSVLHDLQAAIGEDGVREVVALFLRSLDATLATLTRLADAGDGPALMRDVHALSSAALSLGLTAAGAAARQFERQLQTGHDTDLAGPTRHLAARLREDATLLPEPAVTR